MSSMSCLIDCVWVSHVCGMLVLNIVLNMSIYYVLSFSVNSKEKLLQLQCCCILCVGMERKQCSHQHCNLLPLRCHLELVDKETHTHECTHTHTPHPAESLCQMPTSHLPVSLSHTHTHTLLRAVPKPMPVSVTPRARACFALWEWQLTLPRTAALLTHCSMPAKSLAYGLLIITALPSSCFFLFFRGFWP